MQRKASTAVIVVAVVVLVVLIVGIWYLTVGRKASSPGEAKKGPSLQPTAEDLAARKAEKMQEKSTPRGGRMRRTW